ncbi:HvfC/BufC family peptide modification chaperone [Hydrogenimonas cancrithermarum]|uniref:Putative DNA-binding domain-containing protein n=1 Tax=Hydrogenimonas cancrithermarum TaxID=2993563 RepID=A0ABM8FJH8_9BACT|nr:putative DNA-binding domain-containing protein [Hydrogenimonas cancrithermarum]BDY12449.1 hypothetical protein HCR_07610 [Hydrogenimonas cancrithermarum]
MRREREIQERFFKSVRSAQTDAYTNGDIYEKLIFYRFDETLRAAYPLFRAQLSEKKWEKLVKAFIASGPESPFMWKMPKAFRRFAVSKMKKRKWLKDLLRFEWTLIALTMVPCKKPRARKVDFSKRYRLGRCARIEELKYPVMYGRFKPEGSYRVAIYQTPLGGVAWMALTPFMGDLLERCDGKRPLGKIVKQLSKTYGLCVEDAEAVLAKGLKRLLKFGVLVPK